MNTTIKCYGKYNLFLYLKSYSRIRKIHNVITLMDTIKGVYDVINIQWEKSNFSKLIIYNKNPKIKIPTGETNTIYKAWKEMKKYIPSNYLFKVSIKKTHMPGSGFGLGSSNAGNFISFINKEFNLNLSNKQLIKIGLRVGFDVPFFIFNKQALISYWGKKYEFKNIKLKEQQTYKNFKNISLTKDIYKIAKVTHKNKRKLKIILKKIKTNETIKFINLFNDLEKPYLSVNNDQHLRNSFSKRILNGSGSSWIIYK